MESVKKVVFFLLNKIVKLSINKIFIFISEIGDAKIQKDGARKRVNNKRGAVWECYRLCKSIKREQLINCWLFINV